MSVSSILNQAIDTARHLVVIGSRSASLASYFNNSIELTQASEVIGTTLSGFSVYSGLNTVASFFVGSQKSQATSKTQDSAKAVNTLNSTRSVAGVAMGVMSSAKILDYFSIISIAEISSSLGGTSVIAQTLSTAFSFGNITQGLGIFTLAIGITIDSINIHLRDKKISNANEKAVSWIQPIDQNLAKDKIQKINEKIGNLDETLDCQTAELQALCDEAKAAKESYETTTTTFRDALGFENIPAWFSMKIQAHTTKQAVEKKENKVNQILNIAEKIEKTLTNVNNWTVIDLKWDHLSADEQDQLSVFADLKKEKWKKKSDSLENEQVTDCVGLSLKTVSLVMAIATFVLAASGIGIVALSITFASIALVIALANISLYLYKTHKERPVLIGVPSPSLQ